MFLPVYLAALAATVFYCLLPLIGAFSVRQQWRQFRKSVTEAAVLPVFKGLASVSEEPGRGLYRIQGEVDAIGGEFELWLTCQGTSCVVDLRDSWVYMITHGSGEDTVERRRWSNLTSVGPGARVFVAGSACLRGGRILIGSAEKEQALVILHDGDDDSLVRRAIWSGRHKNEYWNPVSQISMALGAATMSIIVTQALPGRVPSLVAALTFAIACSPALSLLPPGVVGFLLYRRYWRQARYCRSRRDVALLETDQLDSARTWGRRAHGTTTASMLALSGALAVNGWLLVFLLRRFL
ncbi:MAG: hypothetical protein RBT62_04950 [Spirochaetia bacterium]|jgi:hypothetical protein|nr:hypothetical protein [Spirochaetia bacterium]